MMHRIVWVWSNLYKKGANLDNYITEGNSDKEKFQEKNGRHIEGVSHEKTDDDNYSD